MYTLHWKNKHATCKSLSRTNACRMSMSSQHFKMKPFLLIFQVRKSWRWLANSHIWVFSLGEINIHLIIWEIINGQTFRKVQPNIWLILPGSLLTHRNQWSSMITSYIHQCSQQNIADLDISWPLHLWIMFTLCDWRSELGCSWLLSELGWGKKAWVDRLWQFYPRSTCIISGLRPIVGDPMGKG